MDSSPPLDSEVKPLAEEESAAKKPDFEEVLENSTGKDSHIVPGCVLAAVDSSGHVFYSKAHGHAGVSPTARAIDYNDTFWIASCTKLFTAICALQQVEKGLVTLDEDISRILPELANPDIITADLSAEDGFTWKKAEGKITLRQLLTHTSGVGYEFMSPLLQIWRKKNGPSPEVLKGKVADTYNTPLLFEPGQGWAYGGGLDWAGIMVERLNNKQPLGEYFEEHIFKPLGMDSTTFHIDQRPDIKERLVPHAVRGADGKLSSSDTPIFSETVTEHSGGGGLWASVPDYIKVLADLISATPTLLTGETIDTMLAFPQLSTDSPALKTLTGARGGAVAQNAAAVDVGINYGLGGMVLTKASETLPAGTCSWGGLPNLKWFFNREHGIAAFYGSQVMPSGDKHATELSNAYFKEVVRLHGENSKGQLMKGGDGVMDAKVVGIFA